MDWLNLQSIDYQGRHCNLPKFVFPVFITFTEQSPGKKKKNAVLIKIQNSYSTKYTQMRPATFKMSYWYAQFEPLVPGSPHSPDWHTSLIWLAYSIYYHITRSLPQFVFKAPIKHPAGPVLQWCHRHKLNIHKVVCRV